MFDKWLKIPAHYYLRATALTILVVGIAISNVLMSIGAIWIISNWLIEADFSNYKKRLFSSPEIILILFFLLFCIVSMLWSDDFWYGFKDIKIKLPLLAIPLALATGKPLESKIFYFVLYLFIGIIVYTSLYNYIAYNYSSEVQTDIRLMSRFISQIRFALLIDLAFFSCIFLIFEKRFHLFLALPIMAWLAFYVYKSQVLNGYILFAILSLVTAIYATLKLKSWRLKLSFFSIIVLAVFALSLFIFSIFSAYKKVERPVLSSLEKTTANGADYYHDTTALQTENGNFIWLYVCEQEAAKEWNKRSAIDFHGLDNKGQPMFGTLYRYLTSKNYHKDSVGVWQLTQDEVTQIENGVTSAALNEGLKTKIHAFLFEYDMYKEGADPNGFSLLQRLEHIKTAFAILSDYWLTGVGIGDVDLVFQDYYKKTNTKLLPENQLRAHNQFISSWIALGILGLLLVTALFVVPIFSRGKADYFLVICLFTVLVGCLFEDMFETQAGATIFALFYSLAVFRERPEKS